MAATSFPAFAVVAANLRFYTGKKKKKISSFRPSDLLELVLNINQIWLGKDTDFEGKSKKQTDVLERPPNLW